MTNIAKLLRIARPLYGLMAGISGLIIIGSIIELLVPVLSKFIIDEVTLNITTGGEEGELSVLVGLIAASFAVSAIGVVLTSLSERLGDHFAGRLRRFLMAKFYDKVLSLPQSYFDSELSGKITNQLNRGIMSLQGFMNTATNFILPTFLQSIFTIAVLAYWNPLVAALTASLFPIYLGLSYYSSKRWGKYEIKKNALEDVTRGRIQEVISNIKLVKLFRSGAREFDFIDSNQEKINDIYAVQSREFHIFDFLRNLSLQVVLLAINIVVFYGAFLGEIGIGEVVLIIQLVNQARRPLFAMSFILTQIQTAESGAKEFMQILELDSSDPYPQTNERLSSNNEHALEPLETAEIELRDIEFAYPKLVDSLSVKGEAGEVERGKPVLNGFSLELAKSQTVALVGKSGAGKSTVINLILRLYKPDSGEILLNGKSYREWGTDFVRSNISLVFQENELFSTTIRDNVAYANPRASDEQIWAALKAANAEEFVRNFENGLDTAIGERGLKLSGGQKQRIQIARAIMKDVPILILDEATSNLDSEAEFEVQSALENLYRDKLVIIIAHRFSTIQSADKIVVIEDGVVSDSGAPAELAKKDGLYSRLLRYQLEGDKKVLANFDLVS